MSVTPYDVCVCRRCGPPFRDGPDWRKKEPWWGASWMALCPECGDKRCSGAIDHDLHGKPPPPPTAEELARIAVIRAAFPDLVGKENP